MRVAIYVRVSTEEQANEGYSISAQKERCSKFVDSQGDWSITKVYADPGHSAKNLKRPAMQQLLQDIKLDVFDVVVVYRLDRMVRSVLDLHNLLGTFEKHNVKFKSVTEVFDTTTAMGKFFITIVGAMAEWERDNLSERVSMGMEQLAREGNWKGGVVGYGHDRIDGKMVIIEEEAQVIRNMYDWYINEGFSDRKISHRLNDMGITTRQGALWTEGKIRSIMRSKRNIGVLEYGVRVNKDRAFDVPGVYEPIIDEKTYELSLKIRKARNKNHGRQATSNYYFSGHLRCARCGGAFKGIKKKSYKKYRCINSLNKQCDFGWIEETIIDHQFVKEIRDLIKAPKNLKEDNVNDHDIKKSKSIKRELNKIAERRKKWQYAWASDMLSDSDFQLRMEEEKKKESEYQKQLSQIDHQKNNEISDEIIPTLKDVSKNWNELSDIEKKQLIQITLDYMVIDVDPDLKMTKNYDKLKIVEIVFN